VGHNAGSKVLGQAATAVSIATLGAALAAAGALHLVIARKAHLRPLISALAVVCPLIAAAFGAAISAHLRPLVAVLAASIALGLVTDAAAVASHRPGRVVIRAGMHVTGFLAASIWLHTLEGFLIAQAASAAFASICQFATWIHRPDFSLLRSLGRDVWSNHIAGVTGSAPAYIVAPLATVMSSSQVAGQAYLAMALVGPLTSVSVALAAGVHTDGKRSATDTRDLYVRSVLTVFVLACIASVATALLHLVGPSFTAIAPVVAVMTFATVLDASSNIYTSLWRLQRRLVVVPLLYSVELIAFTAAVALALGPWGIKSIAWGWYAQGLAGVAVVVAVERRLIPARQARDVSSRRSSAAERRS
jgi:hypothetical protein